MLLIIFWGVKYFSSHTPTMRKVSFGSEVNKFSLEPSDGIEDPLGVWLFGPWQRVASWLSACQLIEELYLVGKTVSSS